MDIIKFSLKNPITIFVCVILIILFGLLSVQQLPYQLTPSVTKPEIKITTRWNGATPYEIEREIIEEQENVLKSLNNLVKYESSSRDNSGDITLTFTLGTNLRDALQDVSNKLNEVASYPDNVKEPIIETAIASPVIWTMLQTTEENPRHIDEYKTFFDDEIKPLIRRVDGVASTTGGGGRTQQMQIEFDTNKLASYGLTIPEVIAVLRSENVDVSAGLLNLGRKAYRIRTVNKFTSVEDIESVILRSNRQQRIRIRDIATVEFGYETPKTVAMFLGKDGIFLGIQPSSDANIVELTNEVEKVVNELNETILKREKLKIHWLYDQRPYIVGAVNLVQQNIIYGGILAIMILILFLRSTSATSVVAVAIPISVIGTFIILDALGRSLNTISLAGISFAVGMLVDAAIVVIENIDRHRKNGLSPRKAAYEGTKEVWGALIASALTTVAVFLPIIFLEDEAGQLFKDIAIAVTVAVSFSLFVSVCVIPVLWERFARFSSKKKQTNQSPLVNLGNRFLTFIMSLVTASVKNRWTKLLTLVSLIGFSGASIYFLQPKMDYLPQGNKNLIFNILVPPPGLSYEERYAMGEYFMNKIKPHINEEVNGFPAINRAFFVSFGDFNLFGGTALEESRARELLPLFRPIVNSLPSIIAFSVQSPVFERGIGEGNSVDIDISGRSIDEIANTAFTLYGAFSQTLKGSQLRPIPSFELLYAEMRIHPNQDALQALGMDSQQLGIITDVLMDGRKVGDFEQMGKKKIDLILKANDQDIRTPQDIMTTPIVLPNQSVVPLSSLATYENRSGISQIRHLNGKRTITLQVKPPDNVTIEEMMRTIDSLLETFDQQGMIPNDIDIALSGAADKLVETLDMLSLNFLLALVIIYLLLSALFGHFMYPLVIMFTVPLAMAGGVIGLKLTHMFLNPYQTLDVLTMLGFIILIGIVVNNAILIVHQSLYTMKQTSMHYKDAILYATKTRVRPIYMSSLTSIFGMLPLVLIPGPGSEFYQGLGSVITGGLAFSTIFTLFVTPVLLTLFMKIDHYWKEK